MVVSILVAFNLAIAQPLLDLLGRNAQFFVARDAPAFDVVLLAAVLALLAPLAVVGIVLAVRRMHAGAGTVAHGLAFTVLVGALALQAVKRAPLLERAPGGVLLGLALALGVAVALALFRLEGLRRALRFGWPLPLIVAGLFLFVSPASKLVFAGEAEPSTASVRVRDPAPIVMLVLDEFPVASLMDRRGRIDARLFPNFARLAREGTWYRNATTVHEFTEWAVPALLTGNFPTRTKIPIASDYPRNLFTLLERTYDVRATEPITDLCRSCRNRARVPLLSRWKSLASDLRVVGMHTVLPADLTRGLPRIDQAWGGFAKRTGTASKTALLGTPTGVRQLFHEAVGSDRPLAFERFIATIQRSERPTLSFFHSMLPHTPWQYLPSGAVYTTATGVPGIDAKNTWEDDPWLPLLAWQRHIVQVQFVDTLIGRLIARLEQQGLYDRALIVITSDHGASFMPGALRRSVTEQTLGEIAAVPLFIKRPHQQESGIDDRPVQSIDVLPTIAGTLGLTGLRETDGESLLDPGAANRTSRVIMTRKREIGVSVSGREVLAVVRRKFEVFGRRGDSLEPYLLGPDARLIGRKASKLTVRGAGAATVLLDDPGSFEQVDPQGDVVPALISGLIRQGGGVTVPGRIAVALNGTIAGVTRTDRSGAFTVLVPQSTFRRGANRPEVFGVDPGGDSLWRVRVIRERSGEVAYRLEALDEPPGARITASTGPGLTVLPGEYRGWVDSWSSGPEQIELRGWAGDVRGGRPVDAVAVFVNGRSVQVAQAPLPRGDVAAHFGKPGLRQTGFRVSIPVEALPAEGRARIRVFALVGTTAAELRYQEGYPWP